VRENHGSLKADLDIFLKKQQDIERDIIEYEKQKAISSNQIENLYRDIQRIDEDTKGRREEIAILRGKVEELNAKENAQLIDIQQVEKEEEKRLGDLDKANLNLDNLTKKLADVNRSLDSKKNEFKLTKSMVESMEGFPESIQFLSKDKTWKAPLLSDLIYVQEAYRTAIENYLEPYLNYYVVQNLEEAYSAIRLLNNAQKGKANFFLLDAFKETKYLTDGLVNARSAVDLVQVDGQYQPLFNFLLHNVLIAETENLSAFTFYNDSSQSGFVFLAKSGAMSRRRFSITGGSVGLFEGKKIGRKKNLEILEKEIQNTEGAASEAQKQLTQVRSDISFLKNNDRKKDVVSLNEALNKIRQERVFLQTRLDNFSTFIDEADDKKTMASESIDMLIQKMQNIDNQLIVKRKDEENVKSQMANADGSYRNVADMMTQLSQVYNEKNIEFIRQQNKVSTLQNELSFRERQMTEGQTSQTNNEKSLVQQREELEHVEADIERYDGDLKDNYKERREREGGLNEFEQAYFQKKNAINKMEDDLRKLNRQRMDLQSLVNNLKDKFNDLKLNITSIGERLQVEFSLSVNDVINLKPKEGLNKDELQRKVDNQKRQLDTYGEINPMAVEAFNEMKERHDLIDTQRNDIVEAKVSLLETMKEIEETATTQFMEAFNTVRLSFIEVFKSLFFEEDTADLILTEPNNPLESGIQIIAKPKGKRPQSIHQLSGGEKTLTATALLFALYLYKPAPFCIFDEVDAPLDDANIEKFNKIIKKFSKDSQFIIVTHNKATMAAVDVIYGVHMPEQGVSEVTPVDFREFGHVTELAAA
jgi:chromosome segregation protein